MIWSCISLLLLGRVACGVRYEPTWESLDTRPLPQWYDDAKIGIFVHWGVFSVPSFGSEWFWHFWQQGRPGYTNFMENNYRPDFTYQDFASKFTAELFEPDEWAELFAASGARYVVLTSKHHEGYTLWPSKYSWNWNSMDVGPKKDLVGLLSESIQRKTPHIRFGLYHSLFEWYNRLYNSDEANGFNTNLFVQQKTLPELYELVETYRPSIIWSDGDAGANATYWQSQEFLSWLFNDSPVKDDVVVNDRWGTGVPCHHGSFYTCHDRYNPGEVQEHKWENCMTLDRQSWGYRRNAKLHEYLTIEKLLETLAETVSCGGNLLVNVGPTHDGRICPIMEERLEQLGSWLRVNGEAIYYTRPWKYQQDIVSQGVWYTHDPSSVEGAVYAISLSWPYKNTLILKNAANQNVSKVFLLGFDKPLLYKTISKGLMIQFPSMAEVASQWAYVVKLITKQG